MPDEFIKSYQNLGKLILGLLKYASAHLCQRDNVSKGTLDKAKLQWAFSESYNCSLSIING